MTIVHQQCPFTVLVSLLSAWKSSPTCFSTQTWPTFTTCNSTSFSTDIFKLVFSFAYIASMPARLANVCPSGSTASLFFICFKTFANIDKSSGKYILLLILLLLMFLYLYPFFFLHPFLCLHPFLNLYWSFYLHPLRYLRPFLFLHPFFTSENSSAIPLVT